MREIHFFSAAGILLNSYSGIHGNMALAFTEKSSECRRGAGRRVDAGIHTRQRGIPRTDQYSGHPGDISIFIFYHGGDCQWDDTRSCCVSLSPLFPLKNWARCLVWINSWLDLDASYSHLKDKTSSKLEGEVCLPQVTASAWLVFKAIRFDALTTGMVMSQ